MARRASGTANNFPIITALLQLLMMPRRKCIHSMCPARNLYFRSDRLRTPHQNRKSSPKDLGTPHQGSATARLLGRTSGSEVTLKIKKMAKLFSAVSQEPHTTRV
ncbi:hypothetical protein AVEN_172609-1, partial [Araneus ventricosus]